MHAALPREQLEHRFCFLVAAMHAERGDCAVDHRGIRVAQRRAQRAQQLRVRRHLRRERHEAAQQSQLPFFVGRAARADRIEDATATHALFEHRRLLCALCDRRLRARAGLDERALRLFAH